jgi:DNA modification methylase
MLGPRPVATAKTEEVAYESLPSRSYQPDLEAMSLPSDHRGPDPGDSSGQGPFLSSEQVAARLGVTTRRLRILIRRHLVRHRGSAFDPFFGEADLPAILAAAMGAAPAAELEAMVPLGAVQDERHDSDGRLGPERDAPFEVNRLIEGDALTELRRMPSGFVQSVVTSPPFWGQRLYEDETPVEWTDNKGPVAFGREETPEAYVAHSVEVLGELSRVLKSTGTIWWNIGDSYLTRTILHGNSLDRILRYGGRRQSWADAPAKRGSSGHEYLKDKDLILIPFLVANGAQRLGLWLRSIIVWSKQLPEASLSAEGSAETRTHMPEPVTDRPVTGHEYILLFAKSKKYDYYARDLVERHSDAITMNVRTVWSFRPADKGAHHGARFPDELPRRCIALGTNPGDLVLDPFAGHATTLRIAASMKRDYLGIEVSRTYVEEARAGLNHQFSLDDSPPLRSSSRPTAP